MGKRLLFLYERRIAFLLLLGIIIGTIYMNITGHEKAVEWNLFSPEYMDNVLYYGGQFKIVFHAVISQRLKIIIFCIAILSMPVKKYVYPALIFIYGIGGGILGAAITLQYAWWYFPVYFVGVFLHNILYLPAICGIFSLCDLSRNGRNVRNIVIFFTMYLMGVIVESLMYCYVIPTLYTII